jgi:hypothetical protein
MSLIEEFRTPGRSAETLPFSDLNISFVLTPFQLTLPTEPTTWRRILESLIVIPLVKKFIAFYITLRFITVFVRPTNGPYLEPDEISSYPL